MSCHPRGSAPHVLLINPWIHDFAAYDVWAKPMGLLLLASILRDHGVRVSYVDCLDRFHSKMPKTDPHARNGRGPYRKARLNNPVGLSDIPRTYSRYGISPEWFMTDVKALEPPDLILVTSLMTYWYPGVFEAIGCTKTVFPTSPLVLGGIYASLFTEHAKKNSGADLVVPGSGADKILSLLSELTGYRTQEKFNPRDLSTYPYPAYDLQNKVSYVPLLTSLGCPFSCAYCASPILSPQPMRRDPDTVFEEILYWHEKFGVRDFAFYDDALLVNGQAHIIPILERVIASGIGVLFHTPNALHIREISKEIATLMKAAGFVTIRMGLETADFSTRFRDLDHKVTRKEFLRAVAALKRAGFEKNQVGAYLLTGLPGEDPADMEASINWVKQNGVTPILAHYTPIPGTPLWEKAKKVSRYDLEADPIFTNNAVSPCRKEPFSWKQMSALKARVLE